MASIPYFDFELCISDGSLDDLAGVDLRRGAAARPDRHVRADLGRAAGVQLERLAEVSAGLRGSGPHDLPQVWRVAISVAPQEVLWPA